MNYDSVEECRAQALDVVRDHLERGYDEERAKREVLYGRTYMGIDFSISHGIISVPGLAREKDHQFSFAHLAKEVRTGTPADGQLVMEFK